MKAPRTILLLVLLGVPTLPASLPLAYQLELGDRGEANAVLEDPAWYIEPDSADAEFGYSTATAGDVDGDGFSDVVRRDGAPLESRALGRRRLRVLHLRWCRLVRPAVVL